MLKTVCSPVLEIVVRLFNLSGYLRIDFEKLNENLIKK